MNTPEGYTINESEEIAYKYLVKRGFTPIRKIQGCDFRLENGPLAEVKTRTLRPRQAAEMIRDFRKKRKASLIVVSGKHILHFQLTDVAESPEE